MSTDGEAFELPTSNWTESSVNPHTLVLCSRQLYEALSIGAQTTKVRVLDLNASNSKTEAPLSGTLRLVDLKDCPEFAALSYVWGEWSSPKNTITCNGCSIEITRNCHEALVSLRKLFGSITIWVDSICINQSNNLEKTSQIPLMQSIFTHAQPTYVWLGSGSESTDRAMECIKLASDLRVPPIAVPWFPKGTTRTPAQDVRALAWAILKAWMSSMCFRSFLIRWRLESRFNLGDFCSLLETEWLNRVWTFQEILLASDPIIIRGTSFMTWRTFYQCLDLDKTLRPMNDGQYWVQPYHLYPLPPSVRGPWKDLITIWDAMPRPIIYNKVTKRQLGRDEVWSRNLYFEKHIRHFLAAMSILSRVTICLPVAVAIVVAVLPGALLPIAVSQGTGWVKCLVVSMVGCLAILTLSLLLLHTRPRELSRKWIYSEREHPAQIFAVLQALRTRLATNPKDKSFAIHGVLRSLQFPRLEPDYSKSLGYIYLELLTNLLKHDHYLINLLVDSGITNLDAPSWVPDWDTVDSRSWLSSSYIYLPVIGYKKHEKPYWKIQYPALEVAGLWRGNVSISTIAFPSIAGLRESDKQEETLDQLSTLVSSLSKFVITMKSSGLSSAAIFQSMRNAFLADRINFESKEAGPEDDLFAGFDKWWHAMSVDLQLFDYSVHEMEIPPSDVREFLRHNNKTREFLIQGCERFGGKRGLFFAEPSIIGTGPLHLVKGDRIISIVGVSVPLALREDSRQSGRYEVIGPVFADNLMEWGWSSDKVEITPLSIVTGDVTGTSHPWPQSQRALKGRVQFDRIILI